MTSDHTHIICGECPDEPEIYLCGSPRDDSEDIVDAGTPSTPPPCMVCFYSDRLDCTECGAVIHGGPFVPQLAVQQRGILPLWPVEEKIPLRFRIIDRIRRFLT